MAACAMSYQHMTFSSQRVGLMMNHSNPKSAEEQAGNVTRTTGVGRLHTSHSGHSGLHQDSNAVLNLIASSADRTEDRWYGGLFNLPAEDWAGVLPRTVQGFERGIAFGDGQHGGRANAFHVTQKSERRNVRRQSITGGGGHHEVSRQTGRTVQFNSEKARLLRQEMRKHEAWHDVMYHSGTASRLASPDS